MNGMDTVTMLKTALQVMAIGITGVFAVLSVFYATVKILMSRFKEPTEQ